MPVIANEDRHEQLSRYEQKPNKFKAPPTDVDTYSLFYSKDISAVLSNENHMLRDHREILQRI